MAPKTCWVITDGRAGIENQALGLAEAINELTPINVLVHKVSLAMPWRLLPSSVVPSAAAGVAPLRRLLKQHPPPDLWVACGRQSVPLTLAASRLSPAPFRVQLQSPKVSLSHFDLVIAPYHDELTAKNVYNILGATNRVSKAFIKHRSDVLSKRFSDIPSPAAAVMIGGPNSAYQFGTAELVALAGQLNLLSKAGFTLLITLSRRTPQGAADILSTHLQGSRIHIYDPTNDKDIENPYPGVLGIADIAIVTKDSVNMASEAVGAGLPTYVVDLPSRGARARKFERFHGKLRDMGVARPLRFENGKLPKVVSASGLTETQKAAREVVSRWQAARNIVSV